MMSDLAMRVPARRQRKNLGVLHGKYDGGGGSPSVCRPRAFRAAVPRCSRGSVLVELLISLSIFGIGLIGVAAGSRAARMQAQLASRRAAEALAAQQVLETNIAWVSGLSPRFDTVSIGVFAVEVRTEAIDSLPGLVWLRVRASAGTGRSPWQLQSARRIP
jgi:hypothetical protein